MPTRTGGGTSAPDITDPSEIPSGLMAMAADEEVVDAEIVTGEVVAPSTAVEIHDGRRQLVVNDEWSSIDDGDVTPSGTVSIPLYQLNRKADGGFVNEDTGEVVREIDAVLTNKVDTRAWWPVAFGKGEAAPACRSDDNVVPNKERSPAQQPGWEMPNVKVQDQRGEKPADTCAACPNSKWDGDNPPACTESIEFLAFVPTSESGGKVTRLRFSGMALGAARRYWDSFKLRLPKRPPMAFLTHIALEPEETPNGTFLVPRFTKGIEFMVEEARPIIAAREQNQLAWRSAVATEDRPDRAVVAEDEHIEEPF